MGGSQTARPFFVDLSDRIAVLTGARRIGGSVAVALASRGADVVLAYSRSRVEAEDAVGRVHAAGRRAAALQADLSQPEGCESLINETARRFGSVDVLVNMASVYLQKPFDELSVGDWNAVADVDLRAAFLCARAAVPHMRARGGGRIVNFSDWVAASGRPRYPGLLPYYVAKAGVIALTEALALELAGDNILVNAIAPGPIVAPPEMTEQERDAVKQATPLGRWGGAETIAQAVLALLDNDFMTGETVRIDGGRHLR